MNEPVQVRLAKIVRSGALSAVLCSSAACAHPAFKVDKQANDGQSSNPLAQLNLRDVASATARPLAPNGAWVTLTGPDKFVLHDSGPANTLRPTEVCQFHREDAQELVTRFARAIGRPPADEGAHFDYLVILQMIDGTRRSVVVPVTVENTRSASIAVGDARYVLSGDDLEAIWAIFSKSPCS